MRSVADILWLNPSHLCNAIKQSYATQQIGEVIYRFTILSITYTRKIGYMIISSSICCCRLTQLIWEAPGIAGFFSSYLHCPGRNFSFDNREVIKDPSLLAPGPGLRTVVLPTTEHGSLPFFLLPMHQPPGVTIPGFLDKSSESILSSTGSSRGNFLANGALLSTILCMSARLR